MNPVERLRGYHDMEWRKKAEEAAHAERIKEKAAKLFAPVVELLAQLYDAGVTVSTNVVISSTGVTSTTGVLATRIPDPRRQSVKDMSEYKLRVGNATYFLYVCWDDKQPYRMRIGDNGAPLGFTTPEELVDFMLKELCGQLAFPEAKKPEEDSGPKEALDEKATNA